ncbi:MAG: hypothetical protein AB7Q17_18300 [Phycisphaerae bacterium]
MDTLRWRLAVQGAAMLLAAAWLAGPAWGTTIIGGLGNFDVPNETEDECDEFEIELEGVHPDDVYHTYRNPNYGSPTITALPGNIGIRVHYAHPSHFTQRGTIEHFGVSLRDRSAVTAQRFRWHTVVRTPPPPLELPLISAEILYTPGGVMIRETAENRDEYGRVVWVQRRKTRAHREVQLEELMTHDPLIEGADPMDLEPERLLPGEPMIHEDDAPGDGEIASYVVAYEVFGNRRVWAGGEWTDAPGPLLSTMMVASIAEGSSCPSEYLPVILNDPMDTAAPLDGAAFFAGNAMGPDAYGELFYQWRHEGVDMPGEDNPILGIDPVRMSDAGAYELVVRNDCGRVYSHVAYLTILPTPGDMNCDLEINNFDIDLFVLALTDRMGYEASHPDCNIANADTNLDGEINNFDIDPFVTLVTGG